MKKIIGLIAVFAACAYGQPDVLPPLVCSGVTTSTTPVTATSQILSAYVNALQIKVTPASTTCTVSIATSGVLASRTLYSATDATGTITVYPMIQGTTNGVGCGTYRKEMLDMDSVVVSAHTATTATNVTVTVRAVVERMPGL